jgi:peptidoglycan/LPS O-acetylase OafA/YrhL
VTAGRAAGHWATSERAGHWPALDGVRAVGVGAVMCYHLYEPHFFTGGYLGVDVFFVLSGFLITWGLVAEWDRSGHLRFRRFYARRALRLFPALAGVLVFASVLILTVLHGTNRSETISGLPWIVGYVSNWARAVNASNLGVLTNLWSLAVEEQFYLIWPTVLLILLSRRWSRDRLGTAILAVAAAEAVYREALYRAGVSVNRIANGLDTHSDALLVGCAIALWLSSGRLERIPTSVLQAGAWLGASAIAVLMLTGNGQTSFQWGYPLTAIAGGALIADLVVAPPRTLRTVLSCRPAVWVGRRSYGLYVWSYPIYYGLPWPADFLGWHRDLAEMTLSVAVAAVSYQVLELPFLRRKLRFSSRAVAPGTRHV